MIDVIDYTQHEGELPATCAVINMPNEVYHDHSALSKSQLDIIDRSMAHFVYAAPRESTRAMEIGTAIHTAILEPERYASDYMLLPSCKDRRAAEYKAAVKEYGSELVLVGREADKVSGMKQSAYLNQEFKALMSQPGWSEISFFAPHPVIGEQVKCRFDRLTESRIAVDVKKTQDVRYDKFQRSVAQYRYHVQDAFYSFVYELVTGKPLESFKFFAIEEEAPHANKIYSLDDEAKSVGIREAERNIKSYIDFDAASGELPEGLIQPTELMSLPVWALDEEADAEYQL
jgi:hypothetical protein